jgi:hypothetical protein
MMRKFELLLVTAVLAFGSSKTGPTLAQQQGADDEWLHCDIRGQVASFGLYNGYSYFRLKSDPRIFIFFKVTADAVAPRMAMVQSAYISGSMICFERTIPIDRGEMELSIPHVVTSFHTPIDKIVVPTMLYVTVYPTGSAGPAH